MLSEKTFKILEENDMKVYPREEIEYINCNSNDGRIYREIEFYSPAGEDVLETIYYDGTDEGFISAFRENAENFDADEHVELWIDSRGKRGVPETVRELIDDAEDIKKILLDVAAQLEGVDKSEKRISEVDDLIRRIIDLLPCHQYNGGFWSPDGEEILNKSGAEIETLADLFDELYGEGVCITGYYDPKDDESNGEINERTGFYYLNIG